jgi:type II secretory pathway pseudopilin PulG
VSQSRAAAIQAFARNVLKQQSATFRVSQNRSPLKSSAGFSLFELVAFIVSVAIIYASAVNRFAAFPAQAERANFIAITTQLQSSLNLEVMTVLASGRGSLVGVFEGINPMDLLLRAPSNYQGSYYQASVSSLPRRSWYFDDIKGELVYLVNDSSSASYSVNGVLVPTDEIRFSVQVGRGDIDTASGRDVALAQRNGAVPASRRESRVTGVVLQPVIPFVWGEGVENEVMIGVASTQISE